MKTQTGLIFKPERPRVIASEYRAQYLHRMALIAGQVSQLCVEHDLAPPWDEYRDTIRNFGIRYAKGVALQRAITHSKSFKWQRPRPFSVVNAHYPAPKPFFRSQS